MKKLITLTLLTSLAVGCASPLLSTPIQGRSPNVVAANVTKAPDLASYRDVFYFSDRFGFRFLSPSGYVITPSETQQTPNPVMPVQVLEIWQQADFLNRENLPEGPPIISITVYTNPKRLPLTAWKGELSRNDDRPIPVAGQRGLAYTSTGLYDADNVLFPNPDGRYIFRLTGRYADANAPIRQTFRELVANFTFDVAFNPKSSTWVVNYSRLQNLLAKQDWQAADIETRAIIQRLAGPKSDLLFSSQTALTRLPLKDLQTIDNLWAKASKGRFGFKAQQRIWNQIAKTTKNPKAQVDLFGQQVGWRKTKPGSTNPLSNSEVGSTLWRFDTELQAINAPVGHYPWVGVSSSRLLDYLNERSLGCGSCTIDAIYLAGDRYYNYVPAFFNRYKSVR
ncbi:MAG TPA: GUN4 domain-containing protein [Leptolyngbyaceae cyanobacterium M33_DOE_097]|uniref:GUN4 domain-containing protein n=1 Tax=Oscillatoriales cyanobacterium SpSt-418 TaxID=2282169 RepID=A0A7C3KIM7_9CYAN|nr:GUN4 domain-containing protein [Leptolyngbyaceae cyanobacterium M33_DOE_097]